MLVKKERFAATSHICSRGWRAMASAEGSEMDGLDERQPTFLQELDEAMILVKEDVCEWLTRMFKLEPEEAITSSNFLDRLDDGIIMCKLVKMIDDAGSPEDRKAKVPRCQLNATSGSWFARDNIARFLDWCRRVGIRDEVLFETEGLVKHSEEKNVLLTLLELARIGANRNLDMPRLVQMEREIDREQTEITKTDDFDGLTEKISVPTKPSKAESDSGLNKKDVTDDANLGDANAESSDTNNNNADSPSLASEDQKDVDVENQTGNQVSEDDKSPNSCGTAVVPTSPVDVLVHELAADCKCATPFTVERLHEGKYRLNGKMCFLRLFKDNVMVRVGGGWLTFHQYLYRHDACRIVSVSEKGRPRYLLARGRYKQKK